MKTPRTPPAGARPRPKPAQAAHISLFRTAAVVGHAFEEALKPYAVTATQFNVLRILRGAGEGGLCRNEIRDRMIAPVPDVTRLLDRMERARLVDRSRGGSDRRLVTTRITPGGLALLAELDGPVDRIHKRQFGHLGADRLRALVALLDEVRAGGSPTRAR